MKRVFGKIGRADTATDPAPLSMIETTILLKERDEWREGMTVEKIVDELDRTVRLPGLVNAWTMPIKTRIDMLSTGIKTPLGIKVMGDDLETLERITTDMEAHIAAIPGVRSVIGERVEGANYIIIDIDRKKAAQYGLHVTDIHGVINYAIGGSEVTEIISGPYRWSANLRYQRAFRESINSLSNIYIPLPAGGQIPLTQLASIKIEKGPGAIKTENARKTSWLYIDTAISDIGGLADSIKEHIDTMIRSGAIKWPEGYTYIISGQYEQILLAGERMKILIPIALLIVFVILFINFRNASYPLWVMGTAIFFAPIGGLWLMFFAGYNRSVASDVGFIALIGLAAETGIIMLVYLDLAHGQLKKGKLKSLREAVIHGSVMRVRPKLMTVMTNIIGFIPLFIGVEAGTTAVGRIALPMVGGLITSTAVTLILIPVIYEWWYGRQYASSDFTYSKRKK